MPDIRPSADDWKKFSQGLQSDATPEVSGGVPATPGAAVPSYDPLNLAWSGMKGAAKEAIETVQSAPWATAIPETKDSPSPVMSFARSHDAEHPWAEKAGRLAADVAPSFLTPELSALNRLAAFARLSGIGGKYAPAVARGLNRFGQAAWKGAAGGASQSQGDPATAARVGGETGVASQAAREAISAIPHKGIGLAVAIPSLAALAMAQTRRGRDAGVGQAGTPPLHPVSSAFRFRRPGPWAGERRDEIAASRRRRDRRTRCPIFGL